jgi:hypothetical protein
MANLVDILGMNDASSKLSFFKDQHAPIHLND